MKNNKNRTNLHLALAVTLSACVAPAFGGMTTLPLFKLNKFNEKKEYATERINRFKTFMEKTDTSKINGDPMLNDLHKFNILFIDSYKPMKSKMNSYKPKPKNNSFYDLDDAINDLLHGEKIKLQSIIRANPERKKFENQKNSTLKLQNIIEGTNERKKMLEDKKNQKNSTLKLQNIIAGTNARKKMLEDKKNQTLQTKVQTNNNLNTSFLNDSIFNIKEDKDSKDSVEQLKNYGIDFHESFEKQVKAMVTNLAKSVEQENDTDTITTKTKKLIEDIKEGARIVYGANFKENFDIVATNEKSDVNRYIQIVQQVCSYYYYINAQQRSDNIGFQEGTFFIEYTQLSRKRWNTFFENLASTKQIMKRPSAYYERISSHDFGKKCYGMDFRKNENEYIEWLYRFKTMLISETDHGIWIKPEHYGCYYWSETFEHLKGWFESQKGRLADSDYYNKAEWNKERTPDEVTKEFKKLFPDYKGQKTLSAFYKHANNNKQQLFAKKLKQEYSNILYRHGRECYIDYVRLIESCFLAHSNNKKLLGFYAHVKTLHKLIADIQKGKADDTTLITIGESIVALKNNISVLDEKELADDIFTTRLLSTQIKDYFTRTISIVEKILQEKNALTLIKDEPIFEVEFQQEFLLSEEQKELKIKQLKEEALKTEERDSQKIALAKDLSNFLIEYCTTGNNLLDKLVESDVVSTRLKQAPDFRSAESKQLQILLSCNKDGSDLDSNKIMESIVSMENLYDQNLFDATQNLNDNTEGLRKITELRMFNYTSNNPFVQEYRLDNMPCIIDLAIRTCKIAWAVKGDTSEPKAMATYTFKILYQMWYTTLDKIYATLEKHGYEYISKKGKGKEITDIILKNKESEIDEIKQTYENIQKQFEKAVNENSNIKESNKQRFIKKYEQLYKAVIDELDFTMTNLFDFIGIRIQVAKTEDELRNTISSCVQGTLLQYDWENPIKYSAERLKLFHEMVLMTIKKEENKTNLNESQFGIGVIENFDKN